MSKNSENSLVEGLERLGLIASRIRQNQGATPQIEIDIILEELRNLYMVALQLEKENPALHASSADQEAQSAKESAEKKRLAEEEAAKKAAEAKRLAEEAAAKKAAEEKRLAEEAAAKKAAEEKRLAEEAAAKKAAEEKRLAEEAAAKKAAEEKRLAEEAAAKKAAEEKRLAEEEAARKAAEEAKPIFAPEEPAKEATPIMEPQMEKLAGNPNDELFAEETKPAKEEKKSAEASLFDFINRGDRIEEKPTKRTLGDTLNRSASAGQIENRILAKKVSDLRTIININDKFSFMSELFHNNMKAYNDFILRLNALTDREEALACVESVSKEYKWDESSVEVKNFYKIFDRKF